MQEEGEIGGISSRFDNNKKKGEQGGLTWGLLPYVSQKAVEQKGQWFS